MAVQTFTMEDGSEVQFDSDEGAVDSRPVTRGLLRADVSERAVGTFDEVARSLGAPLRVVVDSLRDAAEGVDEIEIAFGVRFSAQAGAVVSQVGGEANLSVKVTWNRGEK